MKVYILGIDGYLGWKLYQHLTNDGHEVAGCDNFFRRQVTESLVPLKRQVDKIDHLDVGMAEKLARHFSVFEPDCVVHLAEIPSAPFSMIHIREMTLTQGNNVLGSLAVLWAMKTACPRAHLLKLGTMGEYCPSSWYHMSKVLDTENCKYAAKLWDLAITDVMQGPVYGVGGRFDYDEIWGTVINRWVAMGLAGAPLLVYGSGDQVRGFLPIEDSMKCFQIAIENPAEPGEYRSINQYAIAHKLKDLANDIAGLTGATVECIPNPRDEELRYGGDHPCNWLQEHGYKPTTDTLRVVGELVESVRPYAKDIDTSKFQPKVRWENGCR